MDWLLRFSESFLMLQRSARLQYALLTLVTVLALTHVYLGAVNNLGNLAHGQGRVSQPFYGRNLGNTLTLALPEAKAAGLNEGDTILTINGHPFTGGAVLLEQLRQSKPGQTLTVTFHPHDAPLQVPPSTAAIVLRPERTVPASLYAWVIKSIFFFLPFFCLLTGLYVVFARPRSVFAWLILGILGYFGALFIPGHQFYSPLLGVAIFWSTLAQTAMPLCLMAFGIYFPERSQIDIRYPWIKWLFIVPVVVLFPFDLFYAYGRSYNFAAARWLIPYLSSINAIEGISEAGAITYFFLNLSPKLRTATGDARRRLRILYVGSGIGLTPFAILVIRSIFYKTDVGQNVSQWIIIAAFGTLLLFPLSLAYVVVVQRAMDLRILIRQGTRYALARQSINIARILLAVWLSLSVMDFVRHPGHQRNVDVVRIFGIIGIFFAFRFRLSKRLQQRIDQRFFREAYSTEQLLSELSDEARNFTEVAPLINTITQRLGDTLHIDRIAVFLRTGDTFRLQFATGAPLLQSTAEMFSLPSASTTITTLGRTKSPANVYRDDPSSWLVDATDAERAALADLSTELLVPLPGRNRLAGVMALGPKRSEEPYTKIDRQLLQAIGSQTGLALENAELFENLTTEITQRERFSREIEIAREVQERLFPQSYPKVAGVDLAGYCRPAQAVGGDYYDFFVLSDGRLALALGDISGKGISAALLMASLRASLRSIAGLQLGDLESLIRHVNNLVYESSTTNRYATFFYAEYEPLTNLLTYVNAGHNPPYILRGDQAIPLEATGTVIGLLPDAEYAQASIPMHPGDVLLAFTDGISEAMNHRDEEWGDERMIACAKKLLAQPGYAITAKQLLNCILETADKFTSGAPQHDDMTLLVCTVGNPFFLNQETV
jgi:sigma-B regulation protein RsbU (phosphoserine phosphatase)